MNKTLILFASVASFAMSTVAFAADDSAESSSSVTADSNGGYKENTKSESTSASGTATSHQKKVKVSVDSNGNTTKTVKTNSSVDPKGLFNKHTSKTTDVMKTNSEGTLVDASHKKVVDGKTVEDTSNTTK